MCSTAPTDPLVSPHLEPEVVAVRQARGLLLMGPAEDSAEIGGVGVADATTHLGHTEIGLDEQPAGLRHAALHDPVLHGSAGLSTYRGCQVPRTEVHCLRDVAEGQGAAEALLDHREHLIQKTGPRSVQLFTLARLPGVWR
jgi:hypothetical protein